MQRSSSLKSRAPFRFQFFITIHRIISIRRRLILHSLLVLQRKFQCAEAEMNTFYAQLSKCSDSKPIALSLISQFAKNYVLESRTIPTINDLFDKTYLNLTYPELLKICNDVTVELSKEKIEQVERDTISQAKGNSFFRHRAGRTRASQGKAACGEVKCPLCVENCAFESYVLKPSSCLEKGCIGNFKLKKTHQYFYQCVPATNFY